MSALRSHVCCRARPAIRLTQWYLGHASIPVCDARRAQYAAPLTQHRRRERGRFMPAPLTQQHFPPNLTYPRYVCLNSMSGKTNLRLRHT